MTPAERTSSEDLAGRTGSLSMFHLNSYSRQKSQFKSFSLSVLSSNSMILGFNTDFNDGVSTLINCFFKHFKFFQAFQRIFDLKLKCLKYLIAS